MKIKQDGKFSEQTNFSLEFVNYLSITWSTFKLFYEMNTNYWFQKGQKDYSLWIPPIALQQTTESRIRDTGSFGETELIFRCFSAENCNSHTENGWSIINNFRGYKCFSFTTSEAAGRFIFFLNWIAYVEELKICPCLGIFLLCSPGILLSSRAPKPRLVQLPGCFSSWNQRFVVFFRQLRHA